MRFPFAAVLFAVALAPARAGWAQVDALQRTPSRFAVLEGARIHYKSLGTGRAAVVLVHGWACDLQVWQGQVAALDGRVRLVVLDLPGHGRSDKPVRSYTMEFLARGVNAVMESAGVDRAVMVGHSMGVPVIREFIRLFPKKVEALVGIDGALFFPGMDSAAVERQVGMFEGPGLAKAFDQMIAPMFPGADQAGLRRMVTQTAQTTPQHVVQSSIRGMMDRSIWRDAPISVPALVVMAKGTQWPADYRARVTALGPDVRYEELSGVHHFLMLERPDLFNPLLLEFLKSLGVMDQ